jgi:hypothetical protein
MGQVSSLGLPSVVLIPVRHLFAFGNILMGRPGVENVGGHTIPDIDFPVQPYDPGVTFPDPSSQFFLPLPEGFFGGLSGLMQGYHLFLTFSRIEFVVNQCIHDRPPFCARCRQEDGTSPSFPYHPSCIIRTYPSACFYNLHRGNVTGCREKGAAVRPLI